MLYTKCKETPIIMDQIKLKARAKINLGLDVIRRREDGYHEVRMVMQNIDLYDMIAIEKTSNKGIEILTNLSYLPTNEDNLIYKAAKLLIDEFAIENGVKINLNKHIPVAAGMAGGSADAAVVLQGINKMFGLGLCEKELMERGLKLGADVPYCIMRGTALSEGIGEILTPLPAAPYCQVLIAKPGISVSTKYIYENLHVDEITRHPDINGIVEAIKEQNLIKIANKLENVLETVTVKKYPIIEEIKDFMKNRGALNALMSGSGPTVFGLYNEKEVAMKAYKELKQSGIAKQVFLTNTYNEKGGLQYG
jgi:4-diphosphocytidyl-2-C-methyl-D-erythritol kinase